MFFQIWNENLGWALLGLAVAFCGLMLLNELARKSKIGGIIAFLGVPAALTVYFIVIAVCANLGMEWAINNQTHMYMNGWFHYAKLYAATAGCIGFMLIKYRWGIGKSHWFLAFPFVIVAINILIAVGSDFESAIKGAIALQETGQAWWKSSEGVWIYGGWWNWVNGIAGIINILCMTGWWCVYSSKDEQDMLWPDMTFWFILAYDVWNFEYTYLNLPNHSWYCGLALLLAPTFFAFKWNRGGWIQNRAFTLAIWCMFAQVFPLILDNSIFTVLPTIYPAGADALTAMGTFAPAGVGNVVPQAAIAIAALAINILVLGIIIGRAWIQKRNPYTQPVFEGTKDFDLAMERAELPDNRH